MTAIGLHRDEFRRSTTSVAVCTYNGAQFIVEQLKSILDQTVSPDEIVVCDDASTDDTMDLIKGIRAESSVPLRLYRNAEKAGPTKNFESAIQRCRGDIIFLADQDDVWKSKKIESILDVFQRFPETALVFSDGEVVDESLKPTGHRLWKSVRFSPRYQQMIADGDGFAALLRRNAVTGAAMAFRRDKMDVAFPFPPQWVHDGWIALMIAAQAEIALVEEPLILYRLHASQHIGTEIGLFGQVQGSRLRTADSWRSQAERYAIALDRLRGLDPVKFQRHVELLAEKVEHSKLRGKILSRQSQSWPMDVAKEVANGRYFLYSSGGWKSILKDVLMPR